MNEAKNHPEGLAVLGFFIEVNLYNSLKASSINGISSIYIQLALNPQQRNPIPSNCLTTKYKNVTRCAML